MHARIMQRPETMSPTAAVVRGPLPSAFFSCMHLILAVVSPPPMSS